MTEHSEGERVAEARPRIVEVAAAAAIAARASATFVDVRELNEWNLFRIAGARHVPMGKLAAEAAAKVPSAGDVIVYCNHGNRSVLAADQLRAMGWTNVRALAGGVTAWMDAGGELED
jgi:rhodanese-related sulfurtransferase